MIYVIIAILILLLIIVGAIVMIRNNKRSRIQAIESRIDELKGRPLQDELIKMKKFNLIGELKKDYEEYRKTWKTILEETLVSASNLVEEATQHTQNFKFNEADSMLDEADQLLDHVEETYSELSASIHQSLGTLTESQTLINDSEQIYKSSKRDVLANRHKYGQAADKLEQSIEEYKPKIEQVSTLFNNGDYKSAFQNINQHHSGLTLLQSKMEDIPVMIKEVQKEIPAQLQEIKYGCKDLRIEGYDLEHINVDHRTEQLKADVNLIEPMISQMKLTEADEEIERIKDEIDDILEMIEYEIKAKSKVDQTNKSVIDELFAVKDMNYTLQTEQQYIKSQYLVDENHAQDLNKFSNEITHLNNVYDEMVNHMNKSRVRYTKIEDDLNFIQEHVTTIDEKQQTISEYFISLKEDDDAYQNAITDIQVMKDEAYRKLTLANLPELPERYIIMKSEIDYDLKDIYELYSSRPLNMKLLSTKMEKLLHETQKFEQEIEDVIYNAKYTERLVQFGNRYRRDHESLDDLLNEAERLFDHSRFKRASEVAEEAIERYEPGATQSIRQQMQSEYK